MLLKKMIIIGTGLFLAFGISTNTFAYWHWQTHHVTVKCAGGTCHKHVTTYNKKCSNGSCKTWTDHFHWHWRK